VPPALSYGDTQELSVWIRCFKKLIDEVNVLVEKTQIRSDGYNLCLGIRSTGSF
jgi:hypothetical protein